MNILIYFVGFSQLLNVYKKKKNDEIDYYTNSNVALILWYEEVICKKV